MTGMELGRLSREVANGKCRCHICWLGNLQGAEFMKARANFKKNQKEEEVEKSSDLRRCNHCFEAVFKDDLSKHCCVGKKAMLANLKEAIIQETRLQLALDTLKEVSEGSEDSFKVQSLHGGKVTTISLGSIPPAPSTYQQQLTHSEVQTMAADGHLTYGQTRSIMANLRSKFGRSFAESGLDKQLALLNGCFLPFFTCTKTHFEKGECMVEKPLFYCHRSVDFLKEVFEKDHGLWIKIIISGASRNFFKEIHQF